MAGLYFHIPFCKRICGYCDFFRVADLRLMDDVVMAMHAEMEEQRNFITDNKIRTIYFGGGTPSLVAPAEIQSFIDHSAELWDCSGVEEITIEANPDDVSDEYVAALCKTAVNRVSLGVQSFDDAELRFMNRRHSAADAVAAVKRLQDAGIDNITVDLIFGVDGFGGEVLERNLESVLNLGVQHVSAYHLTIEPDTMFGRRLNRGEMREVTESVSESEYALIDSKLTAAGYEHYEVSNYALPGFRSRHNSSYWHGTQYLGIGVGAHSFNGDVRHWSQQTVGEYCERREYEIDELTQRDRLNEYVMTSLRCAEGVDLEYLRSCFGVGNHQKVIDGAEKWLLSGDVVIDNGRLRIPVDRFLISDAIIESLFDI
ncbi:MAG: radical SAM family heme chaperone HemW [Alistipes sp.]|nr:radical SAM family heme chaperone HemW [Alistipes sp.]